MEPFKHTFPACRTLFLVGVVLQLTNATCTAEKVKFPSVTMASLRQAIAGDSADKVLVPGELQYPATRAERYPSVVIAHASGGYDPETEGWFAAELNKAGFATLTYDSFIPRKWGSQFKNGGPATLPTTIADGFAALSFMAAEPRIDPARVAIIGFSLGGDVAHAAAIESFHKALSPEHRFAAHVSFYPGFTLGARAGPQAYTGSPVLLLLAEKDELTPAEKVQHYLTYLKQGSANTSIETLIYPGAYHAWANPHTPKAQFFADAGSARKCPMMLVGDEGLQNLVNGQEAPFDAADRQRCLASGRGYTMGFNAGIRAKSLADAVAFLRRTSAR